jgi:hypothetical protein
MMQDAQAAIGSICVTLLLLLLLFIWVVHCSQCGAQHQMLPHLIVSSQVWHIWLAACCLRWGIAVVAHSSGAHGVKTVCDATAYAEVVSQIGCR